MMLLITPTVDSQNFVNHNHNTKTDTRGQMVKGASRGGVKSVCSCHATRCVGDGIDWMKDRWMDGWI